MTELQRGSERGFFKPGSNTLETRDDETLMAALKAQGLRGEDLMGRWNALQNERELAVRMVGIDATDARMGNRDTAMYRLNQLLDENLIARARLAVLGDGTTTGSLMDKAPGRSGKQLMGAHKIGDTTGTDDVKQRDPNLMRLMSKLQIIDLLAYQVDRNPANYWILQDPASGTVTGITGIDNDLALGTHSDLPKRKQELRGFSRYVDKDLAKKVRDLDLDLLPAALADLLSHAEIDALIERFKKLQTELKKETTRKLKPHEWDDKIANQLLEEKGSYWSDIEVHKGRYA